MATQLQYVDDAFNIEVVRNESRPTLTLVHEPGNYDDLERTAPGIAARGVHRGVLSALVGIYAAMLLSFWTFFARDAEAALVLTIVTVLMIVYFGLMIGGIALADTPAPDERKRSFAEFLAGPVETLNDLITGRQVVIQMLFLPASMLVLAIGIGVIARISQGV